MNSQTLKCATRRALILTVAALFASAAAPSTFAAAGSDVSSIKVHFGDLNLNTEEGARTLYRRIQSAAHRVCQETNGREIQYYWKCYEVAVADAVNKVNNRHLTALHQGKSSSKSTG